MQGGVSFIHHSNGSFKAPNTGTNLIALNLGLIYDFETDEPKYRTIADTNNYNEPLHLNLFLRTGINEGDTVGLGQYPFLTLGFSVDKRTSYKSTFRLGTEIFFSKFLEKEIENRAIAFFNPDLAETDYKRVGLFIGYDWRISKISIPIDFGYYVYYPYSYQSRVYERIGLKYSFNNNLYATFTVKAHILDAEAVEFGVGIRI